MKKHSIETKSVHGIKTSYITSCDLVPPIHMTSTFKFKDATHGDKLFRGEEEGFIYTRISNPSITLLEEKTACLENGQSAIATASGMAAISSVIMSLLKPGENFISCTTVYGGTFALFHNHVKKYKIKAKFIAPSKSHSVKDIEKMITKNTRLLYVETPSNPTLDIIDIKLWADIANQAGIYLVVDNTFASPYLQAPLDLGAHIVVHSATKYLGGHGDLIGGLIIGDKKTMDFIREEYVYHFGPSMSPFNAWLILRGMKTLAVRMEKHCDNAMKIALWLDSHPKVKKVYYPGLPSHIGHETAKTQMRKYGGMISFEVNGGVKAGQKVMDKVKLCTLAVSLGDCETLIQHPASMTHATYTKEERQKAGISDGLIRLSVGLENADDIIGDLNQAMEKI